MNDIIHIFPINVFATILLVVIFAFLFYFLFIKIPKYIQAKKSPNATNFRQMITDFGKTHHSLDSAEFLKQLSSIFRSFLEEEKSYENFSKLTLEEILESYSFDDKEEVIIHVDVLQTIYYKQYEGAELDIKERQEIYLTVKQVIHGNI